MNNTFAASSTQLPAWLRGGRIPSLDGVRAIAILLVLYSHAAIPGHSPFILAAIKGRCGFLGVQLFFVLSGFLITALMLRERERTGRVSRKGFYLRRALRILPAYAAYLALVAILPPMADNSLTAKDWFSALTYTVNFHSLPIPVAISHVWSLSVEEHFYLMWPLVLAAGSLRAARCAALGCMVFCLGFRCIGFLVRPDAGPWLDLWTVSRMDDIAVGCLLALAALTPQWRERLDRMRGRLPVIASAIAMLALSQFLGTRFGGGRFLSPPAFALACALSNTINSCCIALLLWAAITRPIGLHGWFLNSRVMTGIGAISYSLYLWHVLFCDPEPGVINAFPQNILLMFGAALLSYFLIEKRFLALKDRLASATGAPPHSTTLSPLAGGEGCYPSQRQYSVCASGR
jgi:peptidoglycan/LPS O-acetylase OafA/YrhL